MALADHCAMMALAMAIDALVGWPGALFRWIGHPVTWLGWLIALGDRMLNRGGSGWRRCGGVALALGVIALVAGLATALTRVCPGVVAGGVLAWPLVATRSLDEHVCAVARPLTVGDLAGARRAVAMIVGRDPDRLDGAGIARAAAESLAENASDGIVAPVLWGVVFGLPGIAVYKAINTMDSMIGHRTVRHAAFGWAAARIDDGANLVPARLTGVLFALVSAAPLRALRVMARDARHHRSPNAGWPEAAFAGALNVRLSGPRVYGDRVADEPWLNGAAHDPDPATLIQGLALYRRAMLALWVALVLGATLQWIA